MININDDDVILHPNTAEWFDGFINNGETDVVKFVDTVLSELYIPFISALITYGWDVQTEEFQRDFVSLLEVTKGILYRQHGLSHPIQLGLDGIPLDED
jgi:hypothetical protein